MITLSSQTVFKDSGEIFDVVVPFADVIASGDSISSASTVVTDLNGTDVSATMVPDAATFSGTNVTQRFTGGTDGTTYIAKVTIVTAGGERISSGFILIVNDAVSGTLPTDAWVTVSEADEYMSSRFGANDYWTVDVEKEAALTTAQHNLENCNLFDFTETLSSGGDGITQSMKDAVYEQALFLVANQHGVDERENLRAMGVVEAGIVQEKYAVGMRWNGDDWLGPNVSISVRAKRILEKAGYLTYGRGFKFTSS